MPGSQFRAGFWIVLAVACSDPVGPGTEGPLVVGARVDGKQWSPDNGANTTAYLTPEGSFLLVAIRRDSLFQAVDGIAVVVRQVQGPGRYPFTSDFDLDYGLYATYDPNYVTNTTFMSAAPNIGELEVTEIDTTNRRIAGRFSFHTQELGSNAQLLDGGRRVRVEAGVFRAAYEPTLP